MWCIQKRCYSRTRWYFSNAAWSLVDGLWSTRGRNEQKPKTSETKLNKHLKTMYAALHRKNKKLMKASNLGNSGLLKSWLDDCLDLREGKNNLVSAKVRTNASKRYDVRHQQRCAQLALNVNQRAHLLLTT
jgi:hypothetical protein